MVGDIQDPQSMGWVGTRSLICYWGGFSLILLWNLTFCQLVSKAWVQGV